MPGFVLVGTQWGDEGKGKITDLLADKMDMVVRYNGGDNAGHTVMPGNKEFKFHLLPSGVLYPHVTAVIANGLVVNPKVLIGEIEGLEKAGISAENLRVSCNAHLVMPYHLMLDGAYEMHLGKSKIGTTRKGIGPAYSDKAARIGIRVQDLLDMKIFRTKLGEALKIKNAIMSTIYNLDPLDLDEVVSEYSEYAKKLEKYITDTSLLIHDFLDKGKNVFLEGAQGTFLDIDHGTYPFVTSSSPISGGACTGAGVGPRHLEEVIGIVKAYVTRVGSGPFPTEQDNENGEAMRQVGKEIGTTTGRPRRCGWFDAVLMRYATRINGLTSIIITKLDVLSKFEKLKICTGYKYKEEIFQQFPPHQTIIHKCEPVYEELRGWQEDITGIEKYEDLPLAAREYVEKIQKIAKVPMAMISVGPKRDQTILCTDVALGKL
jgi:adenylosuccinate synthase